ncbi:MAG: 4-methyl-5(b-hydroxyethyl)-thiazole monophosphate biosynthesis [bacterium]|jgi:4-methyl-5(b-hydroxyethyl)-thiazole monophosphate biosynthesis
MSSTVLVPFADGIEEIEVVTIIDVLRRAGANVTTASIKEKDLAITASRQTKLIADTLLSSSIHQPFDLIVLAGGVGGAENFRDCPSLIEKIKSHQSEEKWYAAICASPAIVFETHGLLEGKAATCYPSFSNQLKNQTKVNESVVIDEKCITSQSPATAMEFSLALVKCLFGSKKRLEIGRQMLFY